jgi:predicted nuclease of predicted toxin-antitoxin system
VRLLLDEMISPAIARELRDRGYDVDAVKLDRPDLESLPDTDLVRKMTAERRGIVTNDVADFQPIHDRTLALGEAHYGMLFTNDAGMPRNKASVLLWVQVLEAFLEQNRDEAALRNRVTHLPG